MTARPPIRHLHEMQPGERGDFFALLADRKRSQTREGKPYYHCRFRDARRVVSFMAWADDRWFAPCEKEWRAGRFYKLRAVYQEHERYGPQIELHILRPVTDDDCDDGFDEALFVETSRHDPVDLMAELRTLASAHLDAQLRALVLGLLDANVDALVRLPATRERAYPFRGGLMEHLVSVTRIAIDLARRYATWFPELRPPIDVGLVCAGAILHDIGRVLELDDAPAPSVTVSGRLFGPQLLGRDLLRDAARAHPEVESHRVQLLEHVLLVVGNGTESASATRVPVIPEAVIVRHADALDLEMSMAVRALERDPGPGPFTERDAGLGRMMLKARG